VKKAVFLNAAKLDFDGRLDFSPVTGLTAFTRFEASAEAEILPRVQGHDIVITKELPVGRALIRAFPDSVRLMVEAGTGYNNLDTAAAKERGITVCNIPGYSSEAVAQLTIALLLNLSSSLHLQQRMLCEKNHDNFTKHLGVHHSEVLGKTLGIIGGGAIGRQVAKVALALGMQVLVCDPSPKAGEDPALQIVGLEELLERSDFVTLHCPLTPDTRHLINRDTLKRMKPSAFLINCARGPIIQEADLIEALQRGTIAGAGLDVQEVEPPASDSPLYELPNVILTPHIGWKPLEARQRLISILADNIQGFLEGQPVNAVN
jgi:glycerate dehydrogenase